VRAQVAALRRVQRVHLRREHAKARRASREREGEQRGWGVGVGWGGADDEKHCRPQATYVYSTKKDRKPGAVIPHHGRMGLSEVG
jgi:hypothetical protein